MAAAFDVQLPTVETTLIPLQTVVDLGDEDSSVLHRLQKSIFDKDRV